MANVDRNPGQGGTEYQRANERELFAGQVVLVTGANRPDGIGAAIAREFAHRGAGAVIITSRPSQESEALASGVVGELNELGTQGIWIPGDLSDPVSSTEIVRQTIDQVGGINVLVNNAGITRDALAMMMKLDDWNIVIDTNLRAASLLTQQAVRKSMRKTGGAVVNIASVAGEYGNFGQANYSAAKAGLIGLTRSNAAEFAQYGISVNAIAPGFVETSLTGNMAPELIGMVRAATPMRRLATPEDVANAAAFFADPRSRMVTGQILEVDGGLDGGILALPGLQQAGYKVPEQH